MSDKSDELMFVEARQIGVAAQLLDGKLATVNLGGDMLILLVARNVEALTEFVARYPQPGVEGWRPVPVMIYERDLGDTVSVTRQ